MLAVYAVVGVTAFATLDGGALAATDAPLRAVAEAGAGAPIAVVKVGAGVAERRWPKPIAIAGLAGCLVLIVALPPWTVVSGVATLAVGVVARLLVRRTRPVID